MLHEDEHYSFLDNQSNNEKMCRLFHIWDGVNECLRDYERLSTSNEFSVRGIRELAKSNKAMWFSAFNIIGVANIFKNQTL